MLADVARSQGDIIQSHSLFHETLRIVRELGVRDNLDLLALVGIANTAAVRENHGWAAKFPGAVNTVLELVSYNTLVASLVDLLNTPVAVVRTQLNE